MDVEPPRPIGIKDYRGATGWVLRYGATLAHVDGSLQAAINRGEMQQEGAESDGIGVPLKSDGKTVGVLVVQIYKPEPRTPMRDTTPGRGRATSM